MDLEHLKGLLTRAKAEADATERETLLDEAIELVDTEVEDEARTLTWQEEEVLKIFGRLGVKPGQSRAGQNLYSNADATLTAGDFRTGVVALGERGFLDGVDGRKGEVLLTQAGYDHIRGL